jgi:hypothetical protein
MVDAVSSPASTPISTFFVGSPEDAVNVMDAVQVSLTDTIRNSIQQNVSAVSRLLDMLGKITGVGLSLFKGLATGVMPVTVISLESTPKTTTDLQSLFLADGPMLGSTLQEANETNQALTDMGIPINAPIQTPVLVVVDNMDGTPPTKTFAWYSNTQLVDVKVLTDVRSSPYPGSTIFVKSTTNGSGKVTQTVSYTTFDDYANRRTTTAVQFSYLSVLVNLALALQVQLALELAQAAKQADKLEVVVDDHRTAVQDESANLTQRRTARDEQLAEALRQLRVLKAEREELRAKARHRVGSEVEGLVRGIGIGSDGGSGDDGLQNGLGVGQVVADAVRAVREGRPFQLGAAFPGQRR